MEIVLVILAILIIIGIFASKSNKKRRLNLEMEGINIKESIKAGKYVCGHPDMDKAQTGIELFFKDKTLFITSLIKSNILATINIDVIKDITIEDASTMERRVTAARMLAVGVFALGMKKNTKHEKAYLVINWEDGKFIHDTIFEFENFGSVNNANTARNKLIKILR